MTGQLSDTRTRFLGVRRPKLMAVPVRGKRSMLCLSNRPWLVSHFCTCLAPVASHIFLVPKPDLALVSEQLRANLWVPCRGILTWAGMRCNPCPMRLWTTPLALRQSSAQRASVLCPATRCAFLPWKGWEKPSTSR